MADGRKLVPHQGPRPWVPLPGSKGTITRQCEFWRDTLMDGLYYLLGNLAICFIVLWGMINDHVPLVGRTVGLLAMPDGGTSEPVTPKAHRQA